MSNPRTRNTEVFTLFPYGPLFAIPVSCTIIGLIFFHIAAFGCISFQRSDINFDGTNFLIKATVGYWSVYNTNFGGCVRYTNDGLPRVWKIGRFVGLFGSFLNWAVLAAILLACCYKYPKPTLSFEIIGICMAILSLFSILLLIGLSTDANLSLAAGGALAIVASVMWAAGAISLFYCAREATPSPTTPTSRDAGPTYPASVIEGDNQSNNIDIVNGPVQVVDEGESDEEALDISEVQVERIQDPNGNETVITTKTTFLPNGTKRVVKTIESIEEAEY